MSTTPASYPAGLRRPLASKSRSQPAAFSLREPRRGAGYVQATGTDTPVFWDLSFTFTQTDAQRFVSWFRSTLQRGTLPFSLTLATEFGDVAHVCRFLPDGLMDHSSQAGVYSYKAHVMARSLVVPAGFDEAGPLIAAMPDWPQWAGLLDRALDAMPA